MLILYIDNKNNFIKALWFSEDPLTSHAQNDHPIRNGSRSKIQNENSENPLRHASITFSMLQMR